MPSLCLVLGDQLFDQLPGYPVDAPVFMREDWGLCTRTRHHKQKIALFLAAMREFAGEAREWGRTVLYERLDPACSKTFAEALEDACRTCGAEVLHAYRPADPFFLDVLEQASRAAGARLALVENPGFLTTPDDWAEFRRGQRRIQMADFYAWHRRRAGLLMEGDGPVGGRWSFDQENRKPIPKGLAAPHWPVGEPSADAREVMELVGALFPDHPGRLDWFGWPTSRAAARAELEAFVEERLGLFGPYEDAISQAGGRLWHSALSPLINMGLLSPQECIDAAIGALRRGAAPLPSVEGFVRQIAGWREFIRHISVAEYAGRDLNQLGHFRRLAPCWRTGETGLPPLDAVIKGALECGWVHHIERLMVAGSVMLMSEVHPGEAYAWFMEMFVDSADWVMAANTFGMSQYSDGGLFATKPYLSGSAYLLKMSDWPKGPWCDVWDGLYWRFIDRHRSLFAANPRMSMIASGVDKIPFARKQMIFARAEEFIARTTREPA